MSTQTPLLPDGLQHIALSFSGGGFRAASFTLGCASLFNHLQYKNAPLLHRVRFISSASGGSITNLVLTYGLRQKKTFKECYDLLIQEMQSTSLLDEVIRILKDDAVWKQRPHKERNLINAFAIAYDQRLFSSRSLDAYWTALEPGMIEEICINTTEFNNGMQFRFAADGTDESYRKAGNKFMVFKKAQLDTYKKIKLGDVLACSSCFPAGFEPLRFPDDFTWSGLDEKALRSAIEAKNDYNQHKPSEELTFGFMDGGIDDNQGLYAFTLAEDRFIRKQGEFGFGHDLFMSCDVTSNYLDGFDFPVEDKRSLLLKPSILQYGILLLVLLGLSIWGLAAGPLWAKLVSAIIPGLLALVLLLIICNYISGLFRPRKKKGAPARPSTWVVVLKRHKWYFLKLPLYRFLHMLFSRGLSVGLLATDVYLKKIRRVSYDLLYKEPVTVKLKDGSEYVKQWDKHAILSGIYLLSTKNKSKMEEQVAGDTNPAYGRDETLTLPDGSTAAMSTFLFPTPAMVALVDNACGMDTTLWFDQYHVQEGKLASLIAAGQITACFNLLRMMHRFTLQPGQSPDHDHLLAMRDELVRYWYELKKSPDALWLYNLVREKM